MKTESKVMLSDNFLFPATKENQQIFTFKQQKLTNVWHFCLKNDWNNLSNRIAGDSFSFNRQNVAALVKIVVDHNSDSDSALICSNNTIRFLLLLAEHILIISPLKEPNIHLTKVVFLSALCVRSWSRAIQRRWWRSTLPASTSCPSSTSCWMTLGNPTRGLASRSAPSVSSAKRTPTPRWRTGSEGTR